MKKRSMIFRRAPRWTALLVLAATISALTLLGATGEEEPQKPAPPGSISFIGKNKVATANSTFDRWSVTNAQIDREHPAKSVIEIEVDASSLNTGVQKRDDHLRSADFFEVEKFPTARIKVYDAAPKEAGGSTYRAKLDLTIRDIEKTYNVEFEVIQEEPLHVRGALKLSRTDFGIGEPYSKINPMSIEDEVPIEYELDLSKQ